jgi:archaellum biogenesis ATPase FlaH
MHSPQDIRLRYALQTTPIFWISNHGPQSISPMNLEIIADIVIKFLKQSKNPVILLDGVEHLIFENGSAPVLRLLRDIQEWIIIERAILIVPVNPDAINRRELALMERNMNELRQNNDGE